MSDLEIPNEFTAHTKIVSADMNEDFDAVETFLNETGVGIFQAGSINGDVIASDVAALRNTRHDFVAKGTIANTTEYLIDNAGNIAAVGAADTAKYAFYLRLADWTIGSYAATAKIATRIITSNTAPNATASFSLKKVASMANGVITLDPAICGRDQDPDTANTAYVSGYSSPVALADSGDGFYAVTVQYGSTPTSAATYYFATVDVYSA